MTGKPDDIERVTSGLVGGRRKRGRETTSLAAYPTTIEDHFPRGVELYDLAEEGMELASDEETRVRANVTPVSWSSRKGHRLERVGTGRDDEGDRRSPQRMASMSEWDIPPGVPASPAREAWRKLFGELPPPTPDEDAMRQREIEEALERIYDAVRQENWNRSWKSFGDVLT